MGEPALKLSEITNNKAEPKDRSKLRVLGLIAMFIAFAFSGTLSYYWFVHLTRFVTTGEAYVDSDLYPVSTKLPGAVKEVMAREGDAVKRGQVLMSLEESDLEFERSFKELKVKKGKIDFTRASHLHRAKAISDFDFENAEAALRAAEMDLRGTEIKLGYTKVLAPEDGVVGKRSVQVGQIVQPGQNLFIVISDQHPWIKANFKETLVKKLRVGQSVIVTIDSYSDQQLTGRIESIFPSSGAKISLLPPENSTGNFTRVVQRIPVKISLAKPSIDGIVLRPGMSAEVEVDTASRPKNAKLIR